jgi:hypothetical protein
MTAAHLSHRAPDENRPLITVFLPISRGMAPLRAAALALEGVVSFDLACAVQGRTTPGFCAGNRRGRPCVTAITAREPRCVAN